MPYRPANENAAQIATHTASTGSAVDFIDTPRPAMMLVAWPGLRGSRDLAHRAVLRRRVVLGDDDERGGQRQAHDRAGEQRARQLRHQALGDEVERNPGQQRRNHDALVTARS